PLTETKDEPVTHKRIERSTNGLMLKVFLLVIVAVVIVMLGLYIRGRLSKRLNADKNLSSVNPVSYDVKYYTEGITNIGGLSRDIPDYVMTTGKLICDSRYADGIADVTERNVKLYAQPDEKFGGIANNTGIMRLFEASTNRVRSSRRIADDLMRRYNDLIRIRGTWQQAKDNGYSEGVWGKYRREEENLLNKLNTAIETVSHEADKAREKMKMNMKTPQTLTYLGEWISPKGKRWIITRSTGSTENRIFWVEAVNVKLMTADEYHNECEKCMKKIDEAEKYSDVKTLSIDVPPMNLMSERTMLPRANPPNLPD
ncbi:MAG: hypothetical protein IJU07_04470, partial [Synergistaceae bacterium]|nr:hypothetical protein [Synergistaceae bacterium]